MYRISKNKKNNSGCFTYSVKGLGYLLSAFLFLQALVTYSQQTPPATASSPKKMLAHFTYSDIEFTNITVVSNVLRITNNTGKSVNFSVKINVPHGWTTLNKSDKSYFLVNGDSMFVPVRVITNNKWAKGGTKYNITAFITSDDERYTTLTTFKAGRPKISDWQISVIPRSRIYMLNDENSAAFNIDLANNGDEAQDLILTTNQIGKEFVLLDSAGRIRKKNYSEYTLRPFSDTLIPYTMKLQQAQRNVRRIDNYGFNPLQVLQQRSYHLFVKASEIGAIPGTSKSKQVAVNFLRLTNSLPFNPHGSGTIPLTMLATINNVLGQQPIMNLTFTGNNKLNEKSQLTYALQTGFNSFQYTDQVYKNINGNVIYNHTKGYVMAGTGVGNNIPNLSGIVYGKGISGGYRLTSNQLISAYYVRTGASFINYVAATLGAAYSLNLKRFRFATTYGRSIIAATNTGSNIIGSSLGFPIGKYQNLNVGGGMVLNDGGVIANTRYNIGYSVRYLKGRGLSTLSYSRTENGGFITNNIKNTNIGLGSSYQLKKGYGLSFQSNYMMLQTGQSTLAQINYYDNVFWNNTLSIRLPPKGKVTYTPSLYCNYSYFVPEKLLSAGGQMSVNTYNLVDNFRLGFFVRGGYNKLLNYPDLGAFFSAQTNVYVNYRTWTANLRYAYGPTGVRNASYYLTQQLDYPQTLGGSLSNQYQFKNVHFLTENSFSYNYLNVNQRNSLSLYSQLFYYTNSGWRFGINTTIGYTLSASYRYTYTPNGGSNFTLEDTGKKTKSSSFQMGMNIKKDFNIPTPKRFQKSRYYVTSFKTFLDVNGNRQCDANEIPLENVVIRLNDYEVLTNSMGEAEFTNVNNGTYRLQVLPLTDIGAWFPVISDSVVIGSTGVICVPFSKGVQILGSVELDREKFSADIANNLDISRIKIFLTDTAGAVITSITDNRGNFKFYVPYGKYTLRMDEKILGNGFQLAENDIPLEFTEGIESYYHTFFIIEKKRRVKNKKFNADGTVTVTESEAGSAKSDANIANKEQNTNTNPDPKTEAMLFYQELIKKAETLLDNPQANPNAMQELRNEITQYLNSAQPDTSIKGMLLKYNEILSNKRTSNNIVVKGTIVINSGASTGNYSNVNIIVVDKNTQQSFTIKPNSTSGKYILILSRKKQYTITIQNTGYKTFTEDFAPTEKDSQEIQKVITLQE